MFAPQTATKNATTATKFGMSKEEHSNQKYPYERCRLFDYEGDISKRWEIEYYVYNRDLGQKVRRKVSAFNRIKSLRARRSPCGC